MKKLLTSKSEKMAFLKGVLSRERSLSEITQTNVFITFSNDTVNLDKITRQDTGQIITRKEAEAICRELKQNSNHSIHWIEWKCYDATDG
jgi:hypothetical protein